MAIAPWLGKLVQEELEATTPWGEEEPHVFVVVILLCIGKETPLEQSPLYSGRLFSEPSVVRTRHFARGLYRRLYVPSMELVNVILFCEQLLKDETVGSELAVHVGTPLAKPVPQNCQKEVGTITCSFSILRPLAFRVVGTLPAKIIP